MDKPGKSRDEIAAEIADREFKRGTSAWQSTMCCAMWGIDAGRASRSAEVHELNRVKGMLNAICAGHEAKLAEQAAEIARLHEERKRSFMITWILIRGIGGAYVEIAKSTLASFDRDSRLKAWEDPVTGNTCIEALAPQAKELAQARATGAGSMKRMDELDAEAKDLRRAEAAKILGDYVLPYSTVDAGNLYFAATEYMYQLTSTRESLAIALRALEKECYCTSEAPELCGPCQTITEITKRGDYIPEGKG